MSNYEAGAASTQMIVLKVLGGGVILNVGGNRAAEALVALSEAWAWCLEPSDSGLHAASAPRIEVVLDDNPTTVTAAVERGAVAATDLPALTHLLTQAITVSGIDHQAGRLLMLHAGAVADPRTHRAVAVVAGAGAGKTTFVRTMGRGRVYLSDETVALREDHSIVPYPKPLSIHTAGHNLKLQLGPQHTELVQATEACSLAALWSLQRSETPTEPRLEPLSTLESITAIAPQTSYLSSLPAPLHRLAAEIDASGGMSRVVYYEAEDLATLVDQAIGVPP